MAGQRLNIRARFVVKAPEVRVRDELEEILISGEILREQAKVEDRFSFVRAAVLFEPGRLHEVKFTADQRLDAFCFRLIVELDRAVKIAVVGDGQRPHAQLARAIHQPVNATAAIEEAVIGVDVEMDEVLVDGRHG
jgi:hypothetical protein